jgi:uncharacterized protein involved in outer membrane biogenesis
MIKLLRRLLILVLALAVVLILSIDFIARKSVEMGVKRATGFPLTIGKANVGLFRGRLVVQDFKLMNTAEFHEGTFVDLPLLDVDYQTFSMLTGSPHVKNLTVKINEIVMVKNEKGQANYQQVQQRSASSKDAGQKPKPEKKMAYRVDLLRLQIGTVVSKDYSSGKLVERRYNLNADVTYPNLTESTSISTLITQITLSQLNHVLGGTIKGLDPAVKGLTDTIQKSTKGLFDSFKKAAPQK